MYLFTVSLRSLRFPRDLRVLSILSLLWPSTNTLPGPQRSSMNEWRKERKKETNGKIRGETTWLVAQGNVEEAISLPNSSVSIIKWERTTVPTSRGLRVWWHKRALPKWQILLLLLQKYKHLPYSNTLHGAERALSEKYQNMSQLWVLSKVRVTNSSQCSEKVHWWADAARRRRF